MADSAPVLNLEDDTPTLLRKGLTLVIQDVPMTIRDTYPPIKSGNYITCTRIAAIMAQVEAFVNPPRTGTNHLSTVVTIKMMTLITKAISDTRPVMMDTLIAGLASIPQVFILIDLKVLNGLIKRLN